MSSEDFDAVFYPGGHGPMWDLADDPDSIALIESFYNSDKLVAAVCHAPAVLHRVMYNGSSIVNGKRVTGLRRLPIGKAADWESFVIVDGRLVTGTESCIVNSRRQGSSGVIRGEEGCAERWLCVTRPYNCPT
jgi:putative intracellular protease/amidase